MSDTADTIELLTLDKEMAEEKVLLRNIPSQYIHNRKQTRIKAVVDLTRFCIQYETLQQDLKTSEERIEELSLELQIIKEEQSPTGDDGGATLYQVRQLEEKNERMKDAIVK